MPWSKSDGSPLVAPLATSCPSRGSAFVRDASRDLHVPNGKTGHDIHVLADAVTGTANVAVEHESVEMCAGNGTSS